MAEIESLATRVPETLRARPPLRDGAHSLPFGLGSLTGGGPLRWNADTSKYLASVEAVDTAILVDSDLPRQHATYIL